MPGPDPEAGDAAGLKGASALAMLVSCCRFLPPPSLAFQQCSYLLCSVLECKCLPYTDDSRVAGKASVEALSVAVIGERA